MASSPKRLRRVQKAARAFLRDSFPGSTGCVLVCDVGLGLPPLAIALDGDAWEAITVEACCGPGGRHLPVCCTIDELLMAGG